MTTSDPTCAMCPRGPEEHAAAEREGVVHHLFSADGQLRPVAGAMAESRKTGEKPAVPAKQEIETSTRALPPADPVLRLILVERGVITVDDLVAAEKKLLATGLLTQADARRS